MPRAAPEPEPKEEAEAQAREEGAEGMPRKKPQEGEKSEDGEEAEAEAAPAEQEQEEEEQEDEQDQEQEQEQKRAGVSHTKGLRSSAVKRASIGADAESPQDVRSSSNPARKSMVDRLAGGARSIASSIGRIGQPVRVHESKWQRRGRRFLTLSLATIGYILFLLNNGSLGDALQPLDCSLKKNQHCVRDGSQASCDTPECWHCVRDGIEESCKLTKRKTCCSSSNTTYCDDVPKFMDRCTRDWVRNGTELTLMLSLLCLTYMAMLGELTLATAKRDDSDAIKQRKVKWGRVAGHVWTVLVVFLLVSLPAVFSTEYFRQRFKPSPQTVGQTSAMVFSVLSIMLSLREIIKHLINWNCPTLQVHVVRVLFMVPVYASDAFGTLFVCSREGGCEDSELALLLEVFREFYEAFTIYSFFRLLQEALRREAELRYSGRDIETPYASLQDLGAGRSTAGNAEQLVPLLDRGRQVQQGGTSLASGRVFGGASSASGNRRSFIERMEHMVGVDVPEDLARLHKMLLLEVSDDARQHKWWGCMCCLEPWPAGYPWLMRCRRGVLQYVLVEVVCALVILLSRHVPRHLPGANDWYGEPGYGGSNAESVTKYCLHTGLDGSRTDGSDGQGDGASDRWVDWATVYPYTTAIVSLSQLWSLYCLVHFYFGTKQILAPYKPGAKFVSIKLIVFFSFWQSMAISMWFSKFGSNWLKNASNEKINNYDLICWLNSEFQLSVGSFAAGCQALLICVEMFVASLVHRSVFSYRAFKHIAAPGSPQASERTGPARAFLNVFQETRKMQSVQDSERGWRSERSHRAAAPGWSRRTDGSMHGSRLTNGSMHGSRLTNGSVHQNRWDERSPGGAE